MTEQTNTPAPAVPLPIVVGVDFSENAARAAQWAAREAADRRLALHLVYAMDLPGAWGELVKPTGYVAAHRLAGEMLLVKIGDTLLKRHPGLALSSEVSELGASETLVLLSRHAHLVVTGTRGHGGFAGMLLGSVSLEVAAYAHCPAVVVRGHGPAKPPNKILVGVEPGQAEAPIRFAFAAAAETGAEVSAVRARWPKSGYGASETDGRVAAQHVMGGNVVPILVGAALGARLVVVGAHRHLGLLSMGAGHVVQGLLAHSPTPVAVVPVT
jgi:nucleotide-binding universal stress UspA family protein